MNVLFLTEEAISFSDALVRGGAIHVRNVVEGLHDRGHDVHLLDWNSAPERSYQHSISPVTPFVEGPARTAVRARRIVREYNIDVIVSKTRKTYLPGLLAAWSTGVPHVVHVGSSPSPIGTGLSARLDAASLTGRLRLPHNAYLVVCRGVGDELATRGVDGDRIYSVGNAIDPDRFHPDRRPTPPSALESALETIDADLVLGYVGGLYHYKGLDDLARALDLTSVDAAVVVAGDGPDSERLRKLFGDRGAFLGAVPYESVPAVYHAVDAFVLPSHTEGLPRVVLEAQATETPVLTTRVGCIPDVVRDGETGVLCNPHDPSELAVGIERLANPSERAQIGEASRRAVEDEYDWELLYDRYERALEQIVEP